MAHLATLSRGQQIVTRWRILAEHRLVHLTELYESGRWRRYFTEDEFLDNIHATQEALATWRLLAPPDGSGDAFPDCSWLDRTSGSELPPLQLSRLMDAGLGRMLEDAVARAIDAPLPLPDVAAFKEAADDSGVAPMQGLPPNPFLADDVAAERELRVA